MRSSELRRNTAETQIALSLNLDGTGRGEIRTGAGFLDHMLTLLARHSRFDLRVQAEGDTQVDCHHLTEDIGICLGKALREALGDKRGIRRYGQALIPMDEALVLAAADLSGRGVLGWDLPFPTEKVGDYDTELFLEFFTAFCANGGVNLHLRKLAGLNSHHIAEAAFKAAARALREAVSLDPALAGEVPSSKGVLE